MAMSTGDRDVIKLILRSPDKGDGWRNVSDTCWPLVNYFQQKDLVEIDTTSRRVRLSPAGEIIAKYAI